MKKFGLVGTSLNHSFSKAYFEGKFKKGQINAQYQNFELDDISKILSLFNTHPDLLGLNITIPFKQTVIQFLDDLDTNAEKIGAVNTIKKNTDGKLIGFNTDYTGFLSELQLFAPQTSYKALVLGTGGASLAVVAVLKQLGIDFLYVSRKKQMGYFGYEDIDEDIIQDYKLIINTTPVGTWPDVDMAPNMPYELFTRDHFVYDLIYNPSETKFLREAKLRGASTQNGYGMLVAQAEASWAIWNS
jgi:shikimate dehydrogenase